MLLPPLSCSSEGQKGARSPLSGVQPPWLCRAIQQPQIGCTYIRCMRGEDHDLFHSIPPVHSYTARSSGQWLQMHEERRVTRCNWDPSVIRTHLTEEPGWRSRYSDWLRAGRPRGRSSSPGSGKNFHFSTFSKPALGSTQHPIQSERGAFFPEGKAAGAWSWPVTSR
jgi:hypothetical protein